MLRWAQLVAGNSVPVLEDNGRLPYIEGSWIASIRDSLITINATIQLPLQWARKPQRVGDIAIMDILRKSNLSDLELTQLNYCQYFLQIEFLSDITTSDGTRLIPAVYTQRNGEPLQHQNDTMTWP